MNTNLIRQIALAFLLIYSFATQALAADKGRDAAAEKLLATMHMETVLENSIDQMLEIQMKQNPVLVPYKQVMKKFFSKYMSYQSLKPDLVQIYAETFTKKELDEITAFYSTPTGQKAIAKIPELISKGAQLGAKRVNDHLPELQQMIKDETARIQQLQRTQP
jgi:hypothetical protein